MTSEEIGGGDRDRTDDLNVANVALSQLSYTPQGIVRVAWRSATSLPTYTLCFKY